MSLRTEPDLASIASLADAHRLLDDLLRQEGEIDSVLEGLVDPGNQPSDLSSITPLQTALQLDEMLRVLHGKIDPTAETAYMLSERVKKLDLEQARVKECLKYVEDVQELKVCRARECSDRDLCSGRT
jgi:Conserved oligomeric Golgi complex subunit 4, N-terminal